MGGRTVARLLMALAVVLGVGALEHNKFKKCHDVGFCRRHRRVVAGESPFSVDASSVAVGAGAPAGEGASSGSSQPVLSGALRHSGGTLPLSFEVSAYASGVVRLRVRAVEESRRRFEVQDVLVHDLEGQRVPVEKLDAVPDAAVQYGVSGDAGKATAVRSGRATLAVNHDPFRAVLLVDGSPAIGVNTRGKLKYEHWRTKGASGGEIPPGRHGDDDIATASQSDLREQGSEGNGAAGAASAHQLTHLPDEDSDGFWEEHFHEHRDSKPFGSSSVGMDITFLGSQSVYGLPERAKPLALPATRRAPDDSDIGEPYRLYNLDVFEYEMDHPMGLYGSIPMIVGHDAEKTAAVLWLNAAETFIDISEEGGSGQWGIGGSGGTTVKQTHTHWFSESGLIDAFFMTGPTPADLYAQYAALTGPPSLPPLFAVAYHQCRWNYKDEADVSDVNAQFDAHDLPYDVIWLDIEHTNGKRYMTWDTRAFPTPERMQNEIAAHAQRKVVVIIDPHIKRDSGYHVHSEALQQDLYVKKPGGGDFDGWCWPGSSHYLDFMRLETRVFWANKLRNYQGSTIHLHVWNDMNEPSVFNGPEVTMQKDNTHMPVSGGPRYEHRDVHNLYGFYVQMATYDGLLTKFAGQGDRGKDARPFVLSRSFYAGSQRYGAVWTGDNKAQWDHLEAAQPMLLAMSVTGLPFVGADVGGFFGNPEPELLARWYQAAVFHPFFRGHAHLDTKRREPWLFGPDMTANIRGSLRTRYRLLPYIYTLFYVAHTTGMPVMRPVFFSFPKDPATFALDDQFMLGPALLVKPVHQAGVSQTSVYLPALAADAATSGKGTGTTLWYDFWQHGIVTVPGSEASSSSGLQHSVSVGRDRVPVFQLGGTVVATRERVRRSSTAMRGDPITLLVCVDASGEASGQIFMDDESTFGYRDGGMAFGNITVTPQELSYKAVVKPSEAFLPVDVVVERIVLRGVTSAPLVMYLSVQNGSGRTKVHFDFDPRSKTVVVRRPWASVTSGFDWSLSFARTMHDPSDL